MKSFRICSCLAKRGSPYLATNDAMEAGSLSESCLVLRLLMIYELTWTASSGVISRASVSEGRRPDMSP
jgi:hypothetical protein